MLACLYQWLCPECHLELSIEDWGECKVVYRHYATLYFIFIVDRQESDLGILDLIQVYKSLIIRFFL